MFVNKLLPSMQPPLSVVRGNVHQRQKAAQKLTKNLYKIISPKFNDNYSLVSYAELKEDIKTVLPNKNFKISVKKIPKKYAQAYDGACRAVLNAANNIKSLALEIGGVSKSIRAYHLPVFMHEFTHAADEFYNPKYLARAQRLLKKGIGFENDAYNKLYSEYYYNEEFPKNRAEKKQILELVKTKTQEILDNMDSEDKLDYLQDMRYNLITEINAYKMQKKFAHRLKFRGYVVSTCSCNFPKQGLFKEKIKILEELIRENIATERLQHKMEISG